MFGEDKLSGSRLAEAYRSGAGVTDVHGGLFWLFRDEPDAAWSFVAAAIEGATTVDQLGWWAVGRLKIFSACGVAGTTMNS